MFLSKLIIHINDTHRIEKDPTHRSIRIYSLYLNGPFWSDDFKYVLHNMNIVQKSVHFFLSKRSWCAWMSYDKIIEIHGLSIGRVLICHAWRAFFVFKFYTQLCGYNVTNLLEILNWHICSRYDRRFIWM